jgi:hypothetical protein
MTRWLAAAFLMASLSAPAVAQEQFDLELMTYPEVAAAMQHGLYRPRCSSWPRN